MTIVKNRRYVVEKMVKLCASDGAFEAKYGISSEGIHYSFREAFDIYVGCRMQSPAIEDVWTLIPKNSVDAEELVARVYARGSAKTYSIAPNGSDDKPIESYSRQREAKNSKYWNVFAGLCEYARQKRKGN